jgi:hypothetical protein
MGKIEEIYKIEKQLSKASEKESKLYLEAMKNKDRLADESRKATEEELWEEVKCSKEGLNCEAGKWLEKKYPEVFKMAREREKLNEKLNETLYKSLGVYAGQLTTVNLLKLIRAVAKHEIQSNSK